jgi:hypothetical protein
LINSEYINQAVFGLSAKKTLQWNGYRLTALVFFGSVQKSTWGLVRDSTGGQFGILRRTARIKFPEGIDFPFGAKKVTINKSGTCIQSAGPLFKTTSR